LFTTLRSGRWVVLSILLVGFLLPGILACCAGKKPPVEESRSTEKGTYLLFVSNLQGNPLCLFGSIQTMRVFPWLAAPKTRWRARTWLVFPGGSAELFLERGKRKQDPSVPLSWTGDSLLFTTDGDRFVFFRPFPDDKLLLLTDPIFPDRVRKSGEDDVRYTLQSASVAWNDVNVQGRVFYQDVERSTPRAPSGFLPLAGLRAGGRSYAIWVPGGTFLYVEQPGEDSGGAGSAVAIMQDRRGRWEEAYQVSVTEPEDLFSGRGDVTTGDRQALELDIPFWKIHGTLDVVGAPRAGTQPSGDAGGPSAEPEGRESVLPWRSMASVSSAQRAGPVRFCLLKGTLQIAGEPQSVYGVGITEP